MPAKAGPLTTEDVAEVANDTAAKISADAQKAIADAAKWIRQREAGRRLVDLLGGPVLTGTAAAAIDREQSGGSEHGRVGRRSKRVA